MTADAERQPASRTSLVSSLTALDTRFELFSRGLYIYTALLVLFLWAPLVVVVFLSFAVNPTSVFPFEGFTLGHYAATALNARLLRTAGTSAQIATISASFATVIGVLASFGIVRYRFAFRRLFLTVGLLPLIIPGVVFGASFFIFFNTFVDNSTGFWPVVIAHTAYGFPFVLLAVMSRLVTFDRSLEECARDLGADVSQAFWDVTFPLIRPAIIAGFLFAWIRSFEDFMRALFISGTMNVLTIEMFSLINFGQVIPMNVVSTIIFVLVAVGLVVAMYAGRVVEFTVRR